LAEPRFGENEGARTIPLRRLGTEKRGHVTGNSKSFKIPEERVHNLGGEFGKKNRSFSAKEMPSANNLNVKEEEGNAASWVGGQGGIIEGRGQGVQKSVGVLGNP